MKQGTTLSQPCVSVYLKRLRRGAKAVKQASGLQEKLRCLPNNTKMPVAATKVDFYVSLFSILDPKIKEKKNKKGLKKNKKKNISKVIAHACYISKPSNS